MSGASGWATVFAFVAAVNSCGGPSSNDIKNLQSDLEQKIGNSCLRQPRAEVQELQPLTRRVIPQYS
jgi:hypothetical protein